MRPLTVQRRQQVMKNKHYGENHDQGEYWNDLSGPKWVEEDLAMNVRFSKITDYLFKKIPIETRHKILDIGCGGGLTSKIAGQKVGPMGEVHGLDISAPMLDLARKRCMDLKHISFFLGDAQTHELANSYYDHIISRFGVMFFENPVKAFANLHRSLKDDGRLTFVCWSNLEENEFFHIPLDIVLSHLDLPRPEVTTQPGPLSLCNTGHTRTLLSKAGFTQIDILTIKTKIASKDDLQTHAKLYLKIGAGARVLGEQQVDKDTFQNILMALINKLKERVDGDEVSLEATLHYVMAQK